MNTIRRAWCRLAAPFRRGVDEPLVPMRSGDRWAVELDIPGRRYYAPAVLVSGLAIDDFVHGLLLDLAQSIHDRDGRADAWTDYVIAVSRRSATTAKDDDLDNAVAHAWDALAPELPSHMRLPIAEARYVERLLDEAVGRVGIEERAA